MRVVRTRFVDCYPTYIGNGDQVLTEVHITHEEVVSDHRLIVDGREGLWVDAHTQYARCDEYLAEFVDGVLIVRKLVESNITKVD